MSSEVGAFLITPAHWQCVYNSSSTIVPAGMLQGANFTACPENTSSAAPDDAMVEDEEYMRSVVHFQYYAWSVTGSVIASLGLLGNMLSITVLCHRRIRSSTSCYLTALAIYDSLVLLSFVLAMSLPLVYMKTGYLEFYNHIFPYIQPISYPIALISQTSSIYTTVGFTVERYIAVCLPLRVAKMCTIARARKSILIILLSSIVYNIPRMLEYHTVTYADQNVTAARFVNTAVGENATFRYIYLMGMHMVVMLAVPFTILMVLNILLIRAVRRSARTKGRVTKKQRRENNLTVMLLSVVIVFLFCQVLSIVDNICMAMLPPATLRTFPLVKLTCIAGLMVITNSAVNFYLYCVFGQKFRCVFVRVYCVCLPRFVSKYFLDDSLTRMASHKDTSPPSSHGGNSLQRNHKQGVKQSDSTWLALQQQNGVMYVQQGNKGKFMFSATNGTNRQSNL